MDEQDIIRLYTVEQLTLRQIATQLGTNHKLIGRILKRAEVAVTKRNKLRVFTPEHRQKISESSKGRPGSWLGKKMPETASRKNMAAKLRRAEVSVETLAKYDDFERLKFLNGVIARHRAQFQDDAKYLAYLDKFYFDHAFVAMYERWLASGKNKWLMPSLDHIHPKSKGGLLELDNLRFITWFENRAKADMSLEEWEQFKRQTNTRSDLFNDFSDS